MKRRDFLGIAGGMAVVAVAEGRMNRWPIGIGGIDMAKMDFNTCTQY